MLGRLVAEMEGWYESGIMRLRVFALLAVQPLIAQPPRGAIPQGILGMHRTRSGWGSGLGWCVMRADAVK